MELAAWANMISLCIVNGCFGFAGIFLNSLVIASFWKSTQLRKKLCYFLILVLACSDLVVVTVIHPSLFYFTILWFTTKRIIPFPFDPFFGFSMFTLLTMNMERYWAVRHPYFHQRSITKRRLLALLFIFWSFALAISFLSYKETIAGEIPGLAILGAIFLLILYINYKMFATVRAIRQNDAVAMGYQMDVETANLESRVKPDVKNISTSFLAIACFFVCSFPVLVHNGVVFARKNSLDDKIHKPLLLWAQTFLSMNSTFNCLIFFWKTTALRREGKKLLERCGFFKGENVTSV